MLFTWLLVRMLLLVVALALLSLVCVYQLERDTKRDFKIK